MARKAFAAGITFYPKIKILRKMDLERHLLTRPSKLVHRRQTKKNEPAPASKIVQRRQTVASNVVAPPNLNSTIKNIPVGARGRKRRTTFDVSWFHPEPRWPNLNECTTSTTNTNNAHIR